MPVFDIILVPDGGFLSKLKTAFLIDLSVSLTVKDNNFPSSMVNLPSELICNVAFFGVAEPSDEAVLGPTEFIAYTL